MDANSNPIEFSEQATRLEPGNNNNGGTSRQGKRRQRALSLPPPTDSKPAQKKVRTNKAEWRVRGRKGLLERFNSLPLDLLSDVRAAPVFHRNCT